MRSGCQPGPQAFAIALSRGQFGGHFRRKPGHGRSQLLHRAPRHQGLGFLAQALMQLGQPKMGGKIAPVDRKRLVKRGPLPLGIASQPVGMGQVPPQRPGGRIGGCCPGKCRDRSSGIARTQCGDPFGVGDLGR